MSLLPESRPKVLPGRIVRGVLAICLLALGLQAAAQPVEVNLRGLRGAALSSADAAHGNTLLVVWTSWSPRCRDTIVDRLNRLKSSWGSAAKIYGLSFNEDAADVERFLSGKALTVPVLLDSDGSFSKKHAITVLPGLVVIQNGRVTYAGKLPDSPDALLSGLLK